MNPIRTPGVSAALPQGGERLSCIVDGECLPDDIEEACRLWKSDGELQSDWRLYHLIGDVLRSDEMRPAARERDAAFLDGLRTRLAAEPVPLAPAPLMPQAPSSLLPSLPSTASAAAAGRRWSLPVAVAAGLAGVMVAGSAVVLLRPQADGVGPGWGAQMAATPGAYARSVGMQAVQGVSELPAGPLLPVEPLPAALPATVPQVVLLPDGRLVRDPRLEAYFEAHRGALAPLPVAMPGAALRSVDIHAVPR